MTQPSNSSKTSSAQFNQLWHDVVVAYGKIQTYTRRLRFNVRNVRRWTYRFARGVLDLNEHHHNELLAMVTGHGLNITTWLDQHFELIESMGDTRETLFAAIKAGVTEPEYVKAGEFTMIDRRAKAAPPQSTVEELEPEPAAEPQTPEERAAFYKDLYERGREYIKGLRRDLHQAQRDAAAQRQEIARLKRTIARIRRDLDGLAQPPKIAKVS